MARPPYLRWLAVAAILLVGAAFEVADRTTEDYPFAAVDLAAGALVDDSTIEWRSVPDGVLEPPDLDGRRVAVAVPAGTPLVGALLGRDDGIPDDWWAVAMPLPPGAVPGVEVRIVLTATGEIVPGQVVAIGVDDGGFGFEEPGLVAVPGDATATVAIAIADGELTVTIRP